MRIINFSILILLNISLFSCGQNQKPSIETKKIVADTSRIKSYNISKGGIDSLTAKGIDIEKIYSDMLNDTVSFDVYVEYAMIIANKGKPKEALKILDNAGKKAKDKSVFYYNKSLVWVFIQPLKQRDSVYNYINKAIKNDSNNAYYYSVRSLFYEADSSLRKAMTDMNKAIALDPSDISYLNMRGKYKFDLGDYEGVIKDTEKISGSNKNNPNMYIYRAQAFYKLKKYNQVLGEIETILKINNAYGKAYLIRGNTKYQLGDEVGGIEDVRKAASLGDETAIQFINEYDKK